MARKNTGKSVPKKKTVGMPDAYIAGSGIVAEETITDTLEKNYMPYAMSVIISRALPEIDGFKPSHRKLLYTMYKMGLLTGAKTKSANIVGQTMKLNPHGDAAIYETMVRLSKGNEALLHPYIDSKGNFGKAYSKNMAYAASRYTEAKLAPICAELFSDIDKDTVDFVPNYDNETTEPTLLPATFPSVLVNANVGIAVSMASAVCPFNLAEVCETTVGLIRNPEHDIMSTLKGPDFPGGGFIIYDEHELKNVYETGRGSIKIRSKYNFDEASNCIEVTEIPPTTTIEAIMDKIIELVKGGKISEISYIRDETDINGLKIAIDIKKGVDPDKLMKKLFRMTPLQDSYACNFNILIGGMPRVMGVREILEEWVAFRKECVKRRIYFELSKKKSKLHLLKGLKKILLDIDKAVKIVRETEEETEVVPNLMIGFGIDETQADYVAEIKLRHLNKEYILNRISEIEDLEKSIAEMEDILKDDKKVKNLIIEELNEVSRKYRQPRKTLFIYTAGEDEEAEEDDTPDFPVTLFISQSGYFKKITPQSLRMSGDQKLKEGDFIINSVETTNRSELLFFSDKAQVYKSKTSLFKNTKASELGVYIPAQLGFDDGESFRSMIVTNDYSGYLIMIFANGKVAKVPLNAYETKTNRKKLANAYSDKSPLVAMFCVADNEDILLTTSNGRAVVFNTGMILPKTTRDTIGVQVVTLKAKAEVVGAQTVPEEKKSDYSKYYVKTIPAAGSLAKDIADADQLSFLNS
ncbi:MAG: DNA topoisomerase (ATP-hydrolyzing) subunit A [Oscillospiraceae bacterium]|nr:DNA topoisomerase (ATP-hydrolyzing) subunit A [Oscillospiraceae bacterium]